MSNIKYKLRYIEWYLTAILYEIYMKIGYSKIVQRNKLFEILTYAQKHVPYFRDLLGGIKFSEDNVFEIIRDLPLLDKSIIREQKRRVFSDAITSDWPYWHNTGGSTGNPLKFPLHTIHPLLADKEMVHQMMLYRKMGYKPGDHICSIDGRRVSESEVDSGIFWGYNPTNFPYGIEHFSTVYLNDKTAVDYINKFNSVTPAFLRGYPSGIKTICDYIQTLNLKLDFKLKGVYLTSENFDINLCQYVSNTFNCPVWGQYGHSEVSVFGYRKPNEKKYYLFPLYGYAEILDSNNNHVHKGEQGEIVVTGFNNFGLPFIRYKTGDLAVYGGTLPNGTLVIDNLLGRSADYLIDNESNKKYLVGLIFGGHLHAFDVIKQWQIEQTEIGYIKVRIVKDSNWCKSTESEIKDFFVANNFNVEIEYVDFIEKTNRGKQMFLIQHL